MDRAPNFSDSSRHDAAPNSGRVSCSRRLLLTNLAKGFAVVAMPGAARAGGLSVWGYAAHPDPRPGIDASNVLTPEQLGAFPKVIPIYDMIREIPEIADGIGCKCGCATMPGYRSLLTCYESGGMARMCVICQAEASAVYRWHKGGRTLDQVRAAVDARFG